MFLDHEEWTLITSAMHVIIGMLEGLVQLRTPNNGGRSIVVMPLVVIQADVGSNPIVHPNFRIGSSVVEQLVEAQRGGGSIPSRCTKLCDYSNDGSCSGLKPQISRSDSEWSHQFCDTVGSIPMRCALRWLGIAIKFMLRSSIG